MKKRVYREVRESARGFDQNTSMVFYLNEKKGVLVELTEREVSYIEDTNKRFLKAQKILERAWKGEE